MPLFNQPSNLNITNLSGDLARQSIPNLFYNTSFLVTQRGTSVAYTTSPVYTLDGWVINNPTTGGGTISRQAHTVGQTTVPYNPTWFMRWDQTSTSGPNPTLSQRLERVDRFSNQDVTITMWIQGSAAWGFSFYVTQNFGSGGSTSVTTMSALQVTTTDWVKYTATITVPSISGKTIGAGSYLEVGIRRSTTGSVFRIDVSNPTLVLGSTSLDWRREDAATERMICERYFRRCGVGASGGSLTTTLARFGIPLEPAMRSTPTLTLNDAAPTIALIAGGTFTGSSSTISGGATLSESGVFFELTGFSGLLTNRPAVLTGNFLDISAEL